MSVCVCEYKFCRPRNKAIQAFLVERTHSFEKDACVAMSRVQGLNEIQGTGFSSVPYGPAEHLNKIIRP